ncbi:MAG: OmpA family protein [Proteobacteria bacterium]|nr:OmpA family protein [Pseudomonadota bacterium]
MRVFRWSFQTYFIGLALCFAPFTARSTEITDNDPNFKNHWLPTFELGLGRVKVHADAKDEINKKGSSGSTGLFLNIHKGKFLYGFGAGASYQMATGTSDDRGIKQSFEVIAPYLGMHGFYELGHGWFIGLQGNGIYGKGAAFDPWNKDKTSFTSYIGPRIEWSKEFSRLRFHSFVQALRSVNLKNRMAQDIQIGFGLAMILNRSNNAPVEAQSVPEKIEPIPEPPKYVQETPKPLAVPAPITLSSKHLSFDRDSSHLRPKSKEFLKQFALILVRYQASWTSLAISGHTDSSGSKSRNEFLSKSRAEAVKDAFISNGVPAIRLKAEGFANTHPLPKLAATSSEHRRVELEFGDFTGPEPRELQGTLNHLIDEYKKQK